MPKGHSKSPLSGRRPPQVCGSHGSVTSFGSDVSCGLAHLPLLTGAEPTRRLQGLPPPPGRLSSCPSKAERRRALQRRPAPPPHTVSSLCMGPSGAGTAPVTILCAPRRGRCSSSAHWAVQGLLPAPALHAHPEAPRLAPCPGGAPVLETSAGSTGIATLAPPLRPRELDGRVQMAFLHLFVL